MENNKKHILIVDDDDRIRDLLKDFLTANNYIVSTAENAKQAKNKLERSIAMVKELSKGHVIKEEDIHLLSPGDGFKWSEKESVIGKTLLEKIPKDEIVYKKHLK